MYVDQLEVFHENLTGTSDGIIAYLTGTGKCGKESHTLCFFRINGIILNDRYILNLRALHPFRKSRSVGKIVLGRIGPEGRLIRRIIGFGTHHGAAEHERVPVGAAQVDVTENNVVGIGTISVFRFPAALFRADCPCGLINATISRRSNTIIDILKAISVGAVLFLQQICVTAVGHNWITVIIRLNFIVPKKTNQIIFYPFQFIGCCIHFGIRSDGPQLFRIADEDIGFSVDLFEHLPREIASPGILAFGQQGNSGNIRHIRAESRRQNIPVGRVIGQERGIFPAG